MSFFGFGKKKKRDGVAVFNELIDQITSLARAIKMYPEMATYLAETGQTFTEKGAVEAIAGSFLVFGEDALKFGKSARDLLGEMDRHSIDLSGLHEVEYLLLLTIVNTILTAEPLAKDISRERDQMAAVDSLYNNENDARRESLGVIIACADLADKVHLHRSLNAPDYVSNILERWIRPEIPDAIAGPGIAAFKRLRSSA